MPTHAEPQPVSNTTSQATSARRIDTTRSSSPQKLDAGTRLHMEARFGHDFSRVRIHPKKENEALNRWPRASALTIGENIFFAQGHYRPTAPEGRRLLAHELAHVVQQRGLGHRVQASDPTSSQTDPLERDAVAAETDPAAARLVDARVKVLPADRLMFDKLRAYIENALRRLRPLIERGVEGASWLTLDNANVSSALELLSSLADDMRAERLVFRFDLTDENTDGAGAMYQPGSDTIRLIPFAPDNVRVVASTATYLLHEYAHVQQDRAAEALLANQRAPQVESYEQKLQRETDGKRPQTYFTEMLRAVIGKPGYLPSSVTPRNSPELAVFDETSEYLRDFEQQQSGDTPEQQSDATQRIHANMAKAYADKLPPQDSDTKTYIIEINADNHAILHWDLPAPSDLGLIPTELADIDALRSNIRKKVNDISELERLFEHEGAVLRMIRFNVVYKNRHVTSIDLRPKQAPQ